MVQATLRGGLHPRPPPVTRGVIRRERVLGSLDDAAQTASVVCLQAPGGYGKTTALAQWAADDPRPVVWLGVRPVGADPHRLAQALLESLHDVGLVRGPVSVPGNLDAVSWHLHALPVVEDLVSSATEPFVAVVDGADALAGAAWECLVESLADSLPEGSLLAMSTREAIPSTLWRLNSRGLLQVLGPEVLAFDTEETSRLMTALEVTMPTERLERLVDETEGWPVAISLMGLSAASRSAGTTTSTAGIRGLNEYLRADILDRLTPEDVRFLERVAVLTTLDAEGCDALAGAPGSLARLRRLASANHLLVPEDESLHRFRMHPLLAQFLVDALHERDPDAWRAAHHAASLVEERRGDLDSAVHHAKLAGDDARLSALVWPHTAELLGYGRWAVVQRWLAGVDDDRLREQCGLALTAAWVALQSGDMTRAARLTLEASLCASDGDASCRPYVDLLEATIGTGGLDRIEASARSFIDSMPGGDRWQTVAHFLLGVTHLLGDRHDDGVRALDEGRRRAEALDVPVMRALCLAGLADAALAREDRRKALSYIREVRALASTHRLDTVATSAPLFTTSTIGYVVEGRYADARKEAARALRLIALMRDVAPWHAVRGRLVLAGVNLTLGDPERAKVLLDEAGDLRGPSSASAVLDRLHTETEQQMSEVTTTLVGTSSLTTAEVRVLQYLPTHLSFPQIAEELVVSRHTVKTQAMSAYRKLGVHTRTQAIERARRAGLLPRG